MGYDQWDVVVALFPFVEERRSKPRPVLVLSARSFTESHDLLVGGMITTAAGGRWESDHEIADLQDAGLRHACVVRFKIMSLPLSLVDRRIGALSARDRAELARRLDAVIPRAVPSD